LHSYVIIFTLGQYARITENFGDVLKSGRIILKLLSDYCQEVIRINARKCFVQGIESYLIRFYWQKIH